MYEKRVKGRYSVYNGKLDMGTTLVGTVMQVVSPTQILFNLTGNNIYQAETFSVIMDDTKDLVDDQRLILDNCVRTGTYKYESVIGGTKTIAEYKKLKTATYPEFLELWNAKKVDADKLIDAQTLEDFLHPENRF